MSSLPPREKTALFAIAIVAGVTLFFGWRLFWFLTDDAFIAFRYASNSLLGHGYVWNPPPFRPVEGYTSFLWVFLLDVIWRVGNVQPPDSANVLSLIFAYGSVLLGLRMLLNLRGETTRPGWWILTVGLTLSGVLFNRTFLTWASSGLETAMFNFFFAWWVYVGIFVLRGTKKWALGLSLSSFLIYLTRPDGLLFAAGTVVLLGAAAIEDRAALPKVLTRTWPLVAIPIHLLWRFNFYGEWLPNTFYAKSTGGLQWESGSRYLLSFIVEYSLWVWLLAGLILVRNWVRSRGYHHIVPGDSFAKNVVAGAVVGHFVYYTVFIGGDHFEFRVYSQLILLIFISFAFILQKLWLSARMSAGLLAFFVLASMPIPWLHWEASQSYTTRASTAFLKVSVSDYMAENYEFVPVPALHYLYWYDGMQSWLIDRAIGARHQEHKIFHLDQTEKLSFRDEQLGLESEDVPVLVAGSVGVISWVLPHVGIIDRLGLNDHVVARNPDLAPKNLMAHARKPPPGYLKCFADDISQNSVVFVPPQTIMDCENKFWDK